MFYMVKGFVLQFDIDSTYLEKFKIQSVGGTIHDEIWVPQKSWMNLSEILLVR